MRTSVLTAELEERFVDELVAVRSELAELKEENRQLTERLDAVPSESDTQLALYALEKISRCVEELREYKPIATLAESSGE
jgi:ABC-type phosphate transport system auxiliary subunit